MKLATIFLIASIMHVSAASMAQHVTLKKSNLSYKQIFKEIRKQTGYSILWETDKFNANEKISVDFDKSSLKEVFDDILNSKGYPYIIEETTIIIQNNSPEKSNTPSVEKKLANIDVTGKVMDVNGSPLGGASVVKKSDGKGTSTSVDGTFYLKNVEEGAILLVKFLGYDPKEIKAEKDLGIIRLVQTQNSLDEVQIQAYGKTSRRLSLSNITSVKAKDIENQVVSNPLLALQGRVSGLRIQQVSGNVGATINVNIQGISSLRGASTPFYVVDGVPYPGSTLEGTGNPQVWGQPSPSLQREASGSPLTYLNPNDIESIEVLKDADATAIYGSRAANGAIIITTKKGKPGALTIDFTAQTGWDKVPRTTEFLNTEQYLQIRREAYANANQIVEPGTYDLDGTWDQNRYTDWQKELIKTQNYSNGNLSVSGGTINSNYRVALTANRRGSPYGQGFRNDNVALSTSLNTASANQKFKLGLVANYLSGKNNLPSLSNALSGGAIISILPPNAPAIYNADGSINWAINKDGVSTFPVNPIPRFLTNPFEVKTNNLTSNLDLTYNVLRGLDLSTSIGYNRTQQQEFSADLLASYPPPDQIYVQRSGALRFTQSNSLIIEPKISYGLQLGAHRIKALAGTTYNRSQGETSGIIGYGQNSDNQVRNLTAASSFNQTGAFYQEYRYSAIFSRLEYSYKDRYLFNLSVRRDGSARFGPANRFGNFGSIAAGWIISEERWLKENAKWVDFLKLRSSYGLTGSDAVGDYSFMDLYSSAQVGVPYQGIVGLSPRGLLNKELQWEEKKSLNIGIEASVFRERLTFGVNYNRNRSSNLLEDLTLPITAGFSKILVNFDAVVENTGWEFLLGATAVKSKHFQWTFAANLTIPENKLVSIPNIDRIPNGLTKYKIDEPLGSALYANYLGVNPLTGLEILEDINGNPVDRSGTPAQTAYTRVSLSPKYYSGLQTTFTFGGFNLNLSFDYVNQMQPRYFFENIRPGAEAYNQPSFAYSTDRWQYPGDIAVIQKYSTAYTSGILTNTVQNFEKASYIRLNNVALFWNVPAPWARKLGMKGCGIGVNAQNLLTISRYSGTNPITGATAMPPTRTIIANLRTSF